MRARLENSLIGKEIDPGSKGSRSVVGRDKQIIYRAKGVISVEHAVDDGGCVVPSSNNHVDERRGT